MPRRTLPLIVWKSDPPPSPLRPERPSTRNGISRLVDDERHMASTCNSDCRNICVHIPLYLVSSPYYSNCLQVSLRPALFDLWPSPWPEECTHEWRSYSNCIKGRWMYLCTICGRCSWSALRSSLPRRGNIVPGGGLNSELEVP